MSFFKKLFGGGNNNKTNPTNQSGQSDNVRTATIKRSIFDFFQLDLNSILDDTFIKAEVGTNISGQLVQTYRKTLAYKECGIFDTVEVVVIDGKSRNIFFKCFDPANVKMDDLKKLIDDLYLIHGNDSGGKGKFTSKDIVDYQNTDFYLLFGRSWSDYPKYKFPVSITRDDDVVSISVWGVETTP